jgi:hypothetical protein
MMSPAWIIMFWPWGEQEIIQCASEFEAARVVYHNTYYGRRCLKISVKAWR